MLIGGGLGLLAERQDNGTWQAIDLAALLAAYSEPEQWKQFLVEGDDVWIVGALGFYHGGAVRRHAGSWAIGYDERRDTPPGVVWGPFLHIASAPDGSLVLPFRHATLTLPLHSDMVRRSAGGAWSVVGHADGGVVVFDTVAAAGGRVVGIGEHVYELEDAATGRWHQRAATTTRACDYMQSAALDGEQLYVVCNPPAGGAVAFSGTLDVLMPASFPSALHAVAALAPNDVWAVGADGLALRHSGAGWRRVAGPPGTLVAVTRAGAAVYVGTADGAVYRYGP